MLLFSHIPLRETQRQDGQPRTLSSNAIQSREILEVKTVTSEHRCCEAALSTRNVLVSFQ